MNRNTQFLVAGIIIALVIVIGSAVWASTNNKNVPATQEKPKELAVVRTPSPVRTQLEYIADELGFFKEKGIKIEWTGELPPGQNYFVALASGAFDVVSWSHADGVIKNRLAGGKIKIIAGSADAVKDYPHMAWYVLENSTIKSAKDLVGKKIGQQTGAREHIEIDGCVGYGLAEYLRLSGIDIKKAEIEGVTLAEAQMEQSLKLGLIDAGSVHPPFKGKIANTPGFRRLFDDYDSISPSYGKGATRITVAREEWLEKNPETARNFLAAMALAADWANAHKEEAKQIWAKRLGIKPENEKYIDSFQWIDHQIVREKEDIQLWINLMTRYGKLKEGQGKATDVYTNEFNPYYKLLKEGKIKDSDILKEAEDIASRNYPSYLKK